MIERYFDAFVYVANWGTHRFAVRLPSADVDLAALRQYAIAPVVNIHDRGDVVITEFNTSDEDGWRGWEGAEQRMPDLIGPRAEIPDGDLRSLYIGWLCAAAIGELDDYAPEPPVPPGLESLSASLQALTRFLRMSDERLDVARERSTRAAGRVLSAIAVTAWVRSLPATEKDDILIGVIEQGEPGFGATLHRRFRRETTATVPAPAASGHTVGELNEATEARTDARLRHDAEKSLQAERKRLAAEAAARTVYLTVLAPHADAVGGEIEALVNTRKATEYDRAARLVTDLRDIAARNGDGDTARVARSLTDLRCRHPRKPRFIRWLEEAGLVE